MKRKTRQMCWLAGLLWASVLSTAHATNMVYLNPASATVNPGDPFQVELWMDFTDPVIVGGVDVTYTGLDYGGFTWNTDPGLPWDDPFFGVKSFNALPGETEVRVGNLFFEFSGNLMLGTFDFALSPGATVGNINLMPPADASGALLPGQQWANLDLVTFDLAPVDVSFSGAQVSAATHVPEPLTAWLMFIGLGTMAVMGAKRRAVPVPA